MNYLQKVIKKHFNKHLVMYAEDEGGFQSSNKCWICNKLFDVGDSKITDHCHITGFVYWSCNINFKLTKKVSVAFRILRGYVHIIMQKIGNF